MTMGQRIGEQRKKLGISQEALGEKLDVSRQAVSKWESDGAVPDVDKLIVMSKLFGVSVGWLLGVEEETAPEKPEELTEKQLRMIEEIVKRYRPEQTVVTQTVVKREGRGFRVLTALGIAVAVILAATALNKIQQMPDYSHRLDALSANDHNVQSQLGALSQQLEVMTKDVPVLMEYSFRAVGFDDLSGAEVTFRGTPSQWQEGDEGLLVATLKGEEIARSQCSFSGGAYTAALELPPANGYSYRFVLCHADGSQEQQILDDLKYYSSISIADCLKITLQGDIAWHRDVDRQAGSINLCPDFCSLFLTPPYLTPERDKQKWESARIIFLLNGEETKSYDLLSRKNAFANPVVQEPDLDVEFRIDDFVIPMQDDDMVVAMLEANLSNGMTFNAGITKWYCSGEQIVEFSAEEIEID